MDEPLAPLPDEPEGDDEDQDEVASASQAGQASASISRAISEPVTPQVQEETVRKPHPLSMSVVPDSPSATQTTIDEDALDAALKPLEDNLEIPALVTGVDDVTLPDLGADALADLTMTELGPDGTQFETAGDLTQIQGTDALLGGEMMDQSGDPFNPPLAE